MADDFRTIGVTGQRYGDVKRCLLLAIRADRPVFLWGPPGIGKSAMCAEIAKELSLDYIDIRLSLMNPVDLRGLPVAVDGEAQWLKPSFLPSRSGSLINFDELNVAPPTVQTSAYQLILDRKVGEFELPKETYLVACGNRAEDAAVVFEMPAPLRNRMIHLELRADYTEWKRWAINKSIDPRVVGFLGFKEAEFFRFDPDVHTRAFPTPRSWHMVSDILKVIGDDPVSKYREMLEGTVGPGTSVEFINYCDVHCRLPNIQGIVENGDIPEVPTEPSVLYALSSGIVYHFVSAFSGLEVARQVEAARNVIGYTLKGGLPKEWAVLISKDLAQTDILKKPAVMSGLSTTKELADWAELVGKAMFS